MAVHLRIKRHLRVLEAGAQARFIRTLDDHVEIPGGPELHAALQVLRSGPEEHAAVAAFCDARGLTPERGRAYFDGLIARGLAERFDPASSADDPFERQLLFYDALDPVTDHAENLARQQKLLSAHVLVLGLGGIGHQVAQSLAAAGVGRLSLVDGDRVERSNLHRQILFAPADVGRPKVDAARAGLARLAPSCVIETHPRMISSARVWADFVGELPALQFVMISADEPVELIAWVSAERKRRGYHLLKCGYMGTQGLIGPMLGPATRSYEELVESWGPLIRSQAEVVRAHNAAAVAPTIAAANGILANIAALEIIKLITGAGALSLIERRLLVDLRDYSLSEG